MPNKLSVLVLSSLLLAGCSSEPSAKNLIEQGCKTLNDPAYANDRLGAGAYAAALPFFVAAARADSGYMELSKAVGNLKMVYFDQVDPYNIEQLTGFLETVNAVCG
jgi:outer membrane murein-binding lipoprotein Lpp